MKKSLFGILLVLFFGLVSATASEKKGSKEEKAQKKIAEQAKKEAAKKEKAEAKEKAQLEKAEANQKKWKAMASLSCPMGGYDEVFIHPDFGRELGRWNGSGFTGFIGHRYSMVIRATNPYTNMELQIANNGNLAVSRMCPGGSISLAQSAPSGNSYARVIWTAEGIINGRVAHGYYYPGDVINGGWEGVANRSPWVMRLDRIDQEF